MFGFGRALRDDLPPINIKTKKVNGLFGSRWVETTKSEQRAMKAELIKKYSDRYFVDDLDEYNSVSDSDFFDEMAFFDSIFDD